MDYKALINALNRYSAENQNHGGVTAQAADAITDLLARAEEAEARAEKAERERDAAVSDLETIMAYGKSVDTCTFCKNAQCYTRGGTKICFPKWRGQKEE